MAVNPYLLNFNAPITGAAASLFSLAFIEYVIFASLTSPARGLSMMGGAALMAMATSGIAFALGIVVARASSRLGRDLVRVVAWLVLTYAAEMVLFLGWLIMTVARQEPG